MDGVANILFYRDWWEVAKELQDEARLSLLDGIFAYVFDGVKPADPMTALICRTIDRDKAKHQEVSEKRRAAAQKKWQKTKDANADFAMQKMQMQILHYDNINNSELLSTSNEVSNNDEEKDKKRKINFSKKEKETPAKFIPPTVEEVADYCRQRNNGIDAEAFVAFYESKGWMVGNNKMKRWQSAVITWEKRHPENKQDKRLGVDEWIEPDGRRTYGSGRASVPMEAPPRPSKYHRWIPSLNAWDDNPI